MKINRLRVHHLRCLDEVELAPAAQLNWLVGPNGSGKTSLLEAIYLLSHGHSFRSGALDALVQRDSSGFTVHAQIEAAHGSCVLGMARSDGDWQIRVNGQDVSTLSAVLQHCAAICFEPGAHTLIAGPADGRRRFLDWGVFHVEHASLSHWREYRRALRQRNALLRTDGTAGQLELWEMELERLAAPLERERRVYIKSFQSHLKWAAESLLPELGSPQFQYFAGWDTDRPLSTILAAQREVDIRRAHTRSGPHRADWRLTFQAAPVREHFSRGQAKLAALACVIAQGSLFAAHRSVWPIVCLDDLTSELDAPHLRLVFHQIVSSGAQVWITATEPPSLDARLPGAVFHVEQGRVTQSER